MKKRVYLTYPKDQVKEPLLYECSKLFDVAFNIRQASVSDKIGLVALELDGDEDMIERAIEFFKSKGVKVEPIELDIIE